MDKKRLQLGMNPSTASHRLVKDLLWFFICQTKDGVKCHRCGQMMDRDTFSIEHKIPWLDSDDPVGHYFDLDNITFSHRVCNFGAARKNKKYENIQAKEKAKQERRVVRRRALVVSGVKVPRGHYNVPKASLAEMD